MTGPTADLDVVVLAGGRSRRMGTDKALLVLEDGRRLVDHVVAAYRPAADRVMVAAGRRTLGCADEVPDAPGSQGPLGGIIGALQATTAEYLAVVPVDAPAACPALVRRLANLCRARDRAAAVAVTPDGVQSLHAVIAAQATPAVLSRANAGERSPRRLLAWLDALVVGRDGWAGADPLARFADDWDQPTDLPAAVAARLSAGRKSSSP